MNPLFGSLFGLWPAALAGFVGVLVPSRDSRAERALLGLMAALTVLFVMAIWPGAAAPDVTRPAEWPQLLNVLIGLPLFGSVAVLFLPRQSPKPQAKAPEPAASPPAAASPPRAAQPTPPSAPPASSAKAALPLPVMKGSIQ